MIVLTDEQYRELVLYENDEPLRRDVRPSTNLIRRNLLTLAPRSGVGYYRLTEYGRAALAERSAL